MTAIAVRRLDARPCAVRAAPSPLRAAAQAPVRRRGELQRRARPTCARAGPAGRRGVPEGDQARTPRTRTSTRAWASPTLSHGQVRRRRRRLPQGAGAEPVLRRRAQRPRAPRSSSPGKRDGGQGRVPGRLQRPHQPDARRSRRATSARPTSRRRTTRRPPTGSARSLNRNKSYPDAYLGLADALRRPRAARGGGGRARDGRQGVPGRARPSCSPWARPTTASAASRRRGRGWRRRARRIPSGAAGRRRPLAAVARSSFPRSMVPRG